MPITHSTKNTESEIDFKKLFLVFKKSIPWAMFIIAVFISLAYLYLRYTKDLFESKAEIKLDVKSEASSFGFKGFEEQNNLVNISGEIELIKSKLLLSKVVEALPLEVSYHYVGNILDEEKFKNSPVELSFEGLPTWAYDRHYELLIVDSEKYEMTINNGQKTKITGTFGVANSYQDFNFKLQKTDQFNQGFHGVKFDLQINSTSSLIQYLENNLNVSPLNVNANTIRVTFTDFNKVKARDIVHTISTLYTKFSEEEKNKATQQKIDFLNEQLKATEKKLEEFESYFEDFTIDNRSINLQSDLGRIIIEINRIDSLTFNLKESIKQFESLKKQVDSDELTLFALTTTVYGNEIKEQLAQLNELLLERDLKLNSYSKKSLIIQRLEDELKAVKSNLSELIRLKIKHNAERLEKLNEQRSNLEQNFVSIPGKNTSYNKNRRFYSLYEENYLALIQKKNEFEIARAGTVTNVYILSPATLPNTPIKPQRLLIYIGAFIIGIFFSILFLVIRYLLEDKIASEEELERLINSPIIGNIPKLKKSEIRSMYVVEQPRSAYAESFRNIRSNLEFTLKGELPHVISITSSIGGEGKSSIATNLGAIMASSGKKSIIIDADLRKPNIHEMFNHSHAVEGGLSTILIKRHEWKEVMRKTKYENLDYLPAGPIPPNPSELLSDTSFKNLLEQLKKAYDYIIIDTPPSGLVTDAVIPMKLSDLQLYIVRESYSKRKFATNISRLIKMNGFNNLSVILNATNSDSSKLGYKYGYYADLATYKRNIWGKKVRI